MFQPSPENQTPRNIIYVPGAITVVEFTPTPTHTHSDTHTFTKASKILDSFCPLGLLVQCPYKWSLWWSMRYQNNQFPSTFFYEVRQKNKWNLDAEEKWCTASGKQMACEFFCSQKVEKMWIAFIARSSAVSQMPGAMGSFSPENKWVLEEQLGLAAPLLIIWDQQ